MLRRCCRRLVAPWSSTDRIHPSEQTRKPLFAKSGPIHMYSNKEAAFKNFTDDRYYGAIRFRHFIRKMWSERGSRMYITGTTSGIIFGGFLLWRQQQSTMYLDGLIGKKKKMYRSRLTVVLDVDETIVSYGDKAFRLRAGLVPRPYLAELLDYMNTIDAEVILWSACSDRYMKQILQAVDPSGVRVSNYIVRSKSWYSQDHWYEKNIAWLKRDPKHTLIVENRPSSVRNCNSNALLVPDFIRGEYMENGQDYPVNDDSLRTLREIIEHLETTGTPVPVYLASPNRHPDIKEIPCHLAMRQLPDELAVGVFFFLGDKYKPGGA